MVVLRIMNKYQKGTCQFYCARVHTRLETVFPTFRTTIFHIHARISHGYTMYNHPVFIISTIHYSYYLMLLLRYN